MSSVLKTVLCSAIALAMTPVAAQTVIPPLHGLYDVRILDSKTEKLLTLDELAAQLKDADVVFLGEYHGNNAAHLLQAQVQQALYASRPQQVLSMEQFTRQYQPLLDQYMAGQIGEATLLDQAEGWKNYSGSYRPLVEFARQHQLPVVAANAPADIVRCVGRKGIKYLQYVEKPRQQEIAKIPFYYEPAYLDKFSGVTHSATKSKDAAEPKAPSNSFYAQLLRDNTMAEAIFQGLQRYPKSQVIHLNGAFHSNQHLGTVSSLKHLDPALKIKVVSPVQVQPDQPISYDADDLVKGDFIYFVQQLPEDYVQDSERQQAMKKMFATADEKAKACQDIQ